MNQHQADRFGRLLDEQVKRLVEELQLEPAEVQVTAEMDVQTTATYSSNGGS